VKKLEFKAIEDPDWDFARNKHILLKSPIGEWSSSIFSSEVFINGEKFIGPNRDCPFQGLITLINGCIVKIIDGILFSSEGIGEKVIVEPYKAKYVYSDLEVDLEFKNDYFQVSFNRDCKILLFFETPNVDINNEWIILYNDIAKIGPFRSIKWINYHTDWIYKIDCGFRYRDEKDYIRFFREIRRIYAPFIGMPKEKYLKIIINGKKDPWNIKENSWINKLYFTDEKIGNLLIFRLSTLRSFGLDLNGIWFPEAGCWWFRQPWTRDALEGIINNFEVYTKIFEWDEKLKNFVIFLMKIVEKEGKLPNIIGCKETSVDALPLLLYLCSKLGINVEKIVISLLKEMEKREIIEYGEPVMRNDLIACIPYQSWIDSRINEKPTRFPEEWNEWWLPKYSLPEVNAYWIRALKLIYENSKNNEIKDYLERMEIAFKNKFWNGEFIVDIIDIEKNKRLNELTSCGVTALSSTLHLFEKNEVIKAFKSIKSLIVYRTLRVIGKETYPFGIAISSRIEPYFGDREYHKSTIWPRDTPYFIKILEYLGYEDVIKGILLNNLDHMISEGAIFYINEIFGHPVGKNPNPTEWSMNPIPLKNPAQYWSHWCDPYIGRFLFITS